jgi:hypothetical protein
MIEQEAGARPAAVIPAAALLSIVARRRWRRGGRDGF